MDDKILKAPEAAELLGITIRTLYNKVQAGDIPHYKGGVGLRFKEQELVAYMLGKEAT